MARVTLKEIASEAGVSIYTASRVLNGKIKEAYRPAARRAQRVRQVAERLGFVPNSSARAMRRRGTKVVGLLVPHNPITSLVDYETVLGINQGLEAQGYVLALIRSSDVQQPTSLIDAPDEKKKPSASRPQPATEPDHPSLAFRERMLDGMVMIGPVPPAISRLVQRITPACLWMDPNTPAKSNCLRRDEYHAGRLVASQLVAKGYRRLIYVSPQFEVPVNHYSFTDRARGVADVARDAGVELHEISLFITGTLDGDITAALAPRLSVDTGLIAATDRVALTLLAQVARCGLRPGVDFGMVSCDRSRHTQTYWPGLSSIDVCRYELGQRAAAMMAEILRNPQHTCPSETVRWAWYEGNTTPLVQAAP